MQASQISVGGCYLMRVSGNVVPVRVDSITPYDGGKWRRGGTHYACTNLKTGRPCSARSASKFRGEVKQGSDPRNGSKSTAAKNAAEKSTQPMPKPAITSAPITAEKCISAESTLSAEEAEQRPDPTPAPPAAAKPTATTGAPTVVPSPTIEVKPACRLSGADGNVFAIIGNVSQTLKRAGQKAKAHEFQTKAMTSHSYDAVLQLCFDYVDVE